ncbi:hypothetical protein R1flu_027470 [Riccia fluitans]|uniref:Uncharacterized protein n=1 Tax=Riccia fluitans TaxID=41844 RepID=A0ABD1XIY0_9MARC
MGATKTGLIYSFVARGSGQNVVVLAEYTAFEGNFKQIGLQCAQKLSGDNHSITYTCDRHTFNYLLEDGILYLVVAEEDFGRKIPFAFLNRIKEEFRKKHGGEAGRLEAHSLDKKFGPVMKDQMTYCVQHPEELDKISKIQSQVQDVKGIMMQNIDKIIERHEKLEVIVDKAGNLASEADHYKRQTVVLKNKMWWQNMRAKLIVLMILIVIALVIWLSVCHGFTCSSGGGGNNSNNNNGNGAPPPPAPKGGGGN